MISTAIVGWCANQGRIFFKQKVTWLLKVPYQIRLIILIDLESRFTALFNSFA